MVHPTQQRRPHPNRLACLTVTTGATVRTFRLPRWVLACLLGLVGVLLPAYVAATGYLIYRDDLLGASLSRQVAIQYAYEDRIAALRTELDRVASRHVVETQGVGDQLGTLLERQAHIERRQRIVDSLLAAASAQGVPIGSSGTAAAGDQRHLSQEANPVQRDHALGYSAETRADDVITGTLLRKSRNEVPKAEDPRPVLKRVQSSLDITQQRQEQVLDLVMDVSRSEVERLTAQLSRIGVAKSLVAESGMGGPFVAAENMHFVEKSAMLDQTLKQLSGIRHYAAALPLRAPISGRVSSTFGNRLDPFLGKPALHAGIDFAAVEGTKVQATAPGTVISADWNGGYGRMVEVRHVGGVTTRYAHLSRILVSVGDRISTGTVVGLVGSTGRSTGPHLHYETRRHGKAADPKLYLTAGRAF